MLALFKIEASFSMTQMAIHIIYNWERQQCPPLMCNVITNINIFINEK